MSPNDPESRIAQRNDGPTHLAYQAEHVVDLQSDIILAAEIYPADHADTQTLVDSLLEAVKNVKQAERDARSKRSWPTRAITRPRRLNWPTT